MDNKGYYKLLGVAENATDEEIKRKYRALALKWHPDRWVNGTDKEKADADKKFKEINEAYTVLSDRQKRMSYDMGFDENGTPNQDPWGFSGDFSFFTGGNQRPKPENVIIRGEDIIIQLDVDMFDANNGSTKTVHYPLRKPCTHCNGTGAEGGVPKYKNCLHCGGSGIYRQTRINGFMTMVTETDCPVCHRTGKVISNPCSECNGTGLEKTATMETIEVNTPAGIGPGDRLNISGVGGYPEGGNGIRGDLIITINVIIPEGYSVIDNRRTVVYEMNVPFYDAMLGCEMDVKLPSGKIIKQKIEEGTEHGKEFVYKNEGLKHIDGSIHGDFIAKVVYSGVGNLTKEQKTLLTKFKNTVKNGN